jgi:outer membrane protein assembly factor BamB
MNKKAIKFEAIIILFVLSIAASITLLPTNAHTPTWQIPTYSLINVAPDPIGVGQTATVNFWLSMPPPTATATYGDRWQNMKVNVIKPDGTNETLGPFTSDATGGTFTTYTPTAIGNYTFQMTFPGQTLAGNNPPVTGFTSSQKSYIGDYYAPSISSTAVLSVQETAIPTSPSNPLPSSYWTRPINAQNNNWYSIGGNWLGIGAGGLTGGTGRYNQSSSFNAWTTSPSTSHILWTKPLAFGGTVGGEYGGDLTGNYYSTREYERMFGPVIMNGILYYTQYPGASTNPTGFTAVDLKTGETLWTKDTPDTLTCGQILNYVSPNQYGAFAYLWSQGVPDKALTASTIKSVTNVNDVTTSYVTTKSTNSFTGTTYNMYDAFTGHYILSIANASSMIFTADEHGSLIGYYINASIANAYNAPTLNCWNSTQAILYPTGVGPNSNGWLWRPPQDCLIPFSAGLMWSAPLATNISGVPLPSNLGIYSINSGTVVMYCFSTGSFQTGFQIEAGYNANTGQQMWIANRTYVPFSKSTGAGSNFMQLNGNGVYVVFSHSTLEVFGYSDTTGEKLWTTKLPDANAYDSFSLAGTIFNNTLYVMGFGGDVYAINLGSGQVLWHYTTGSAGYDSPYGVWPIWTQGNSFLIADGKIYFAEGHEYSPPLFRDAHLRCLNITNGQPIWSILGFNINAPICIADGTMITLNAYDNQLYAYDKGPTKLTVTAPTTGITTATSITISGTITDISSGSTQQAVAANYPHGLPVVSDLSMTDFMEAVYMQQQMPINITGVPIVLSVLDANGNYRTIGTTTSDALGTFAFNWTPDISGSYTVYATFAGSESYYASNAAAHIFASEPTATNAPQATPAPSAADLYFIPAIIGVIIAIIIAGAVLALLVTKKP